MLDEKTAELLRVIIYFLSPDIAMIQDSEDRNLFSQSSMIDSLYVNAAVAVR